MTQLNSNPYAHLRHTAIRVEEEPQPEYNPNRTQTWTEWAGEKIEWVKNNKCKSMLLALGGAVITGGAGYSAYRMLSGNDPRQARNHETYRGRKLMSVTEQEKQSKCKSYKDTFVDGEFNPKEFFKCYPQSTMNTQEMKDALRNIMAVLGVNDIRSTEQLQSAIMPYYGNTELGGVIDSITLDKEGNFIVPVSDEARELNKAFKNVYEPDPKNSGEKITLFGTNKEKFLESIDELIDAIRDNVIAATHVKSNTYEGYVALMTGHYISTFGSPTKGYEGVDESIRFYIENKIVNAMDAVNRHFKFGKTYDQVNASFNTDTFKTIKETYIREQEEINKANEELSAHIKSTVGCDNPEFVVNGTFNAQLFANCYPGDFYKSTDYRYALKSIIIQMNIKNKEDLERNISGPLQKVYGRRGVVESALKSIVYPDGNFGNFIVPKFTQAELDANQQKLWGNNDQYKTSYFFDGSNIDTDKFLEAFPFNTFGSQEFKEQVAEILAVLKPVKTQSLATFKQIELKLYENNQANLYKILETAISDATHTSNGAYRIPATREFRILNKQFESEGKYFYSSDDVKADIAIRVNKIKDDCTQARDCEFSDVSKCITTFFAESYNKLTKKLIDLEGDRAYQTQLFAVKDIYEEALTVFGSKDANGEIVSNNSARDELIKLYSSKFESSKANKQPIKPEYKMAKALGYWQKNENWLNKVIDENPNAVPYINLLQTTDFANLTAQIDEIVQLSIKFNALHLLDAFEMETPECLKPFTITNSKGNTFNFHLSDYVHDRKSYFTINPSAMKQIDISQPKFEKLIGQKTTPTPTPKPETDKSGLGTGAKVGIGLGVGLGAIGITALIYKLVTKDGNKKFELTPKAGETTTKYMNRLDDHAKKIVRMHMKEHGNDQTSVTSLFDKLTPLARQMDGMSPDGFYFGTYLMEQIHKQANAQSTQRFKMEEFEFFSHWVDPKSSGSVVSSWLKDKSELGLLKDAWVGAYEIGELGAKAVISYMLDRKA